MSKFGSEARGKVLDLLCVQCEESFGMPAEILLDGGISQCPHCGWIYRLHGGAGEAMDRMLNRFRASLRQFPEDLD